ncbi:MAG: DUF4199 family protein [Saprospiraceae bacterium]|nr:DUF4199 family protein [Saprospiraceae bacterium]
MHPLSVRYGLISGSAVVLLMLVFYLISKPLMLNFYLYLLVWCIPFWFMYTKSGEVSESGEEGTFRSVFTRAFHIFLAASIMYQLMYFGVTYFDEEMVDVLKQADIKRAEVFIPKDMLKERLSEINRSDYSFNPRASFLTLGLSLIKGGMLSIGVALIKRMRSI